MSMRVLVSVGLVALLCGLADAGPKPKKRRGTFAGYIDPAAAEAPQQEQQKPTPLSIVLLIDRSALIDFHTEWKAYIVAREVTREVIDDDLVAVLAFDKSVDVVLKPVWGTEHAKVLRAVRGLRSNGGNSDVASALEEARTYLGAAPGRKLVVLVTKPETATDKLEKPLSAMRDDKIEVIAISTGFDPRSPSIEHVKLSQITKAPNAMFIDMDNDHGVPTPLEAAVRALHYR